MKLDNKGWGFPSMIILSGIILIFFGISIFFIVRLYNSMEENQRTSTPSLNTNQNNNNEGNTNNTYNQMETNLEAAALNYVKTYYTSQKIDTIAVSINNLKERNMITNIVDQKDSAPCKGYVLVDNAGETNLVSKAYIKCSNYTTSGYQDWRIGE